MILKVKKVNPKAILPTKAHGNDAGLDLYSTEVRELYSGCTPVPIKTGIGLEIPEGYYGQICDRSSMGKKGIKVFGGVIDCGYRDELVVMLGSIGGNHRVEPGDKIAQIVILPVPKVTVVEVDELGESERGNKGFGSSGR